MKPFLIKFIFKKIITYVSLRGEKDELLYNMWSSA